MKQMNFSEDKLEKILKNMNKQNEQKPSKEAIDSLVLKARELINSKDNESRIGFIEFIILQVKIMKKEWWLAQAFLLFIAAKWLSISDGEAYVQRGLSIIASLFVILVIPELWRNIENKSIEIEETSIFNLRKIYAAKLIAFGFVDTTILTLFCIYAVQMQEIMFADILKQFIFPIMIASMICMKAFSGRKYFNQLITMIICIAANMVWMIIVLNENIYLKITPFVWVVMFSTSILLTIYYIKKALRNNIRHLEVKINEFGFE